MKNLLQNIVQKPLWQNILIGIGFLFLLFIIFFLSLGWITGYGKTAKVGSVVGQSYIAAQQQLEKEGFEVVILDSIYVDSIAKLAVIRQTPEADEIVKARTPFSSAPVGRPTNTFFQEPAAAEAE